MPIKGIESARLKLDHASRHLQALTETANEFAHGGHFNILVAWDLNHPNYICRMTVKEAKPTPDLIALQAADVLVNLRAALDHSVYTHVVEHCAVQGISLKDRDLRRIQFPIIEGQKAIERPETYRAEVLEVLERHQPNQHPEPLDHPLARLNRLVNFDKHRVVLVTNSAVLDQKFFHDGQLEYVEDLSPADTTLEPGTEIIRWRFRAAKELTDHPSKLVRIEGGYPLAIDIPDSELYPPLLPSLTEMRDYIVTVLDQLSAAGVS